MLLANGNPGRARRRCRAAGTSRSGTIRSPSPAYLFAMVAGDLGCVARRFTHARRAARSSSASMSSTARRTAAPTPWTALKRSMRWDEEAFGREYDLDIFNIVAVSDFNMGAMENKGLNIFNDKYVLAVARDRDRCRLRQHRGDHRARIFPQLDRQPHHLPRLVPALPQGRADRFPRPGIPSDQRSRPVKRIADVRDAARRAVPRGRGPARPSGAARGLSRDQQLLHGDRLREGRRGRAHAARRCSGEDGFRARHGPLFRAP